MYVRTLFSICPAYGRVLSDGILPPPVAFGSDFRGEGMQRLGLMTSQLERMFYI